MAYNGLGIAEVAVLKYFSSNLAQKLIVFLMFNSALLPCFCQYLVGGSFFSVRWNKPRQFNRFFRASLYTKSASVALVGIDNVGFLLKEEGFYFSF